MILRTYDVRTASARFELQIVLEGSTCFCNWSRIGIAEKVRTAALCVNAQTPDQLGDAIYSRLQQCLNIIEKEYGPAQEVILRNSQSLN
jgi:hypothetical protein